MSSTSGEVQPVQPKIETPMPSASGEESHDQDVERAPGAAEAGAGIRAPQQPTSSDSVTTLPIPAANPVANPASVPTVPQAAAASGIVADDVDLIEKQWVERAKKVVAQTQDDPYKQKKEVSKVKADYIQKRFNKTIKVDDPVSS